VQSMWMLKETTTGGAVWVWPADGTHQRSLLAVRGCCSPSTVVAVQLPWLQDFMKAGGGLVLIGGLRVRFVLACSVATGRVAMPSTCGVNAFSSRCLMLHCCCYVPWLRAR
jgi:hypothetical protein